MPRLYIGNLPRRIDDRDVKKFFRDYGRIRSVDLKNGYGFVEIEDKRDADDAIHDLDGTKLMGERVTVEMARSSGRFAGGPNSGGFGGRSNRYDNRESRDRFNSRRPVRSEYRIIVDDLSTRVSWQDLKDLMRKSGEVTFADAHKLRPNQGVVEFSNHSDMKAAIDRYDGYELYGYKLKVYEDRSARRKSHSRSRSSRRRRSTRSRTRSRSSRTRSNSRSRKRSTSRRSVSRNRTRSSSGGKRSGSLNRSKSKSASAKKAWAEVDDERKVSDRSKSQSRENRVSKSKSKSESVKSRSCPKSGSAKSRSQSPAENNRDASSSPSRSQSPSRSRSNSPNRNESVKSDESDREDENGPTEKRSGEADDSNDENMDSN